MTERSMEIVNDNDNNNKKEGDDQEEKEEEEEEEEIVLPGFRFHPTDEELVGFYLRRKVDKKPLRIELIKQIDLYKYDPWDLPKEASSGSVGEKEKEWYFFCKRGRKYRNSIRPNRVTGSGFWKATGIDKAIHSVKKEGNNNYDDDEFIIGLKKSLVYYRGTAGKGTKTDWMMHEFRLPPASNANRDASPNHLQEAEVWTLCRIFKRIPSYKKYTPSLKDTATAAAAATTKPNNYQTISSNSKTCSLESDNKNSTPYLTSSFRTSDSSSPIIFHNHQQQQQNINVERKPPVDERSHLFLQGHLPHYHHHHLQPPSSMVANYYNPSLLMNHHQSVEDVFANGNWDELTSVVQFAVDHPSTIYDCTLNRQIDR